MRKKERKEQRQEKSLINSEGPSRQGRAFTVITAYLPIIYLLLQSTVLVAEIVKQKARFLPSRNVQSREWNWVQG